MNLPAVLTDLGSIPGLRRSLGEGNGNPLQHACQENSMDRGAWALVHGVAESDTTEPLTQGTEGRLKTGVSFPNL